MADGADQARVLLNSQHLFRIGQRVGDRDFHLDVLAGLHALDRLRGVELRWRRENHGVDVVPLDGRLQVVERIGHVIVRRHLSSDLDIRVYDDGHFSVIDLLQTVEVFSAECARPG